MGERSTAYPGHVAWSALSKTIHILRKNKTKRRTERRQKTRKTKQKNHTTENRIKTNELIKKKKKEGEK